MSELWPADGFEKRLAETDCVAMLFYADWCSFSASVLREWETAEAESGVPFARANLARRGDPRWDAYSIFFVPTFAYFEHGEMLEREESARDAPVTRRDLGHFLEIVEALNEEPPPMRHPKFRARRI